MNLFDHQRELYESDSRKRILIGGRQIGKTGLVTREAVDSIRCDELCVVVTDRMHIGRVVMDRIRRCLEDHDINYRTTKTTISHSEGDGRVLLFTESTGIIDEFDNIDTPDKILVDEAHFVSENILFELEEMNVDLLLTGTPLLERTLVDIWAEYGPRWYTVEATMWDNPLIAESRIRDMQKNWSDEQAMYDVEGTYKRNNRP